MDRAIITVGGASRVEFLNGLLTRDVPAPGEAPRYGALLSPQGKLLADFIIRAEGEALLLDTHPDVADDILRRLTMYRLRAPVELSLARETVGWSAGDMPHGAVPDPRPGLGWRHYGGEGGGDRDALRVEHMIPALGREMAPGDAYILEMGFERLGGVDFRKGCYVGQEIVARMKHKTELRKGLARVTGAGLREGAAIVANGKPVGIVHTVSGDRALAYLRYDRAEGMEAEGVPVTLDARV